MYISYNKQVQVPKEAVGFVIGTKGQSINQLQQVTGCRIQFKRKIIFFMCSKVNKLYNKTRALFAKHVHGIRV